jgi:hypothetical protein
MDTKCFAATVVALLLAARWTPQALAQDLATQGFVRVTQPQVENRAPVSLVPMNASKAQLKKPFVLVATPEHGPFAHGVWLPAGDYTVVGMATRDGKPYPPVTVKAGKLTDMGAWLRVSLGGYEAADIAIRHRDAERQMAWTILSMKDQVDAADPIIWAPTEPPRAINVGGSSDTNLGLVADLLMAYNNKVNRPALNQQLREAPTLEEMWRLARFTMKPQTDEGALDDQGNLYYGANLGQLRVRRASGEWGGIDTGTLEHITAVEASGAKLVVGTNRGRLLASSDRGESWYHVASINADDAVIDIDHQGDRWFVVGAKYTPQPPNPAGFVNMRSVHEVRLYTSEQLGGFAEIPQLVSPHARDLELLRELGRPNSGMWAGYPETFSGTFHGSNYYVGALNELLRVDAATLAITSLKPPHLVAGFNLSGAAPTITTFLPAGLRSKVSVSKDGGATWAEYKRPSISFYDVTFDESGRGRASRWSVGVWKATLEFVDWDPAAKDWKLDYTTPPGCMQILREGQNNQKFCVTTGASILVRDGEGWKAEFAVE